MKETDDCIYHYTNKYENIYSIMTEKFKPFYCKEDLSYIYDDEQNLVMAFPVICFCDIPLQRHSEHRKKYGEYGIGLTKKWAEENHLSIVNYSYKNSLFSACLRIIIDKFMDLGAEDKAFNNSLSLLLMTLKPYEGFLYKGTEKIRFYDEKEWRYIPLKVDGLYLSISLNDYNDDKRFENKIREEQPRIQANNRLNFGVSDVKYIFLKNEEERNRLISDLKKSKVYSDNDIEQILKIIYIEK